jgi:hypothetical protein
MSAIVPNIDEINAWLGGEPESVIKSTYQSAIAEYAYLMHTGNGSHQALSLIMHPQMSTPVRFTINEIIPSSAFDFLNTTTQRTNNYQHTSIKTHAVAIARKAMPLGLTAIFAANKSGKSGAIGIAEETLKQLENELSLPHPGNYAQFENLNNSIDYISSEYGPDWICCRALKAGFVLHHGDIPQETREVFENVLRDGNVGLTVCTNTLAEGVNLPIRTLVLYSVRRKTPDGRSEDLLARDIKNLVGRAGRPGATTHGLVICANPNEWSLIYRVAVGATEEPVYGALFKLINLLSSALSRQNIELTNQILENDDLLLPLADGIDSALIDLAAEEIGETEFEVLARSVAENTFAFRHLNVNAKNTLEHVFALRARRVFALKTNNRLGWIKDIGARMRLIDDVENKLLPLFNNWPTLEHPLNADQVEAILRWGLELQEVQTAAKTAFRVDKDLSEDALDQLIAIIKSWLSGARWSNIASTVNLPIDEVLRIYTSTIAFALQTNIEQGIAILTRLLEEQGSSLSPAVEAFPKHLRFGTQSQAGCMLAEFGVKHRLAYVNLGKTLDSAQRLFIDRHSVAEAGLNALTQADNGFEEILGALIYDQTISDLR